MPEAYIYDHVRTPRGRGKADGALHEVTALALATAPLKALKERNHIKPGTIDDVVLGCVDPVGEAGGDIARMAKVAADKIAGGAATPYLTTKLVTGRFFMERMLPETSLHLARIQTGSATTMELAAEAF